MNIKNYIVSPEFEESVEIIIYIEFKFKFILPILIMKIYLNLHNIIFTFSIININTNMQIFMNSLENIVKLFNILFNMIILEIFFRTKRFNIFKVLFRRFINEYNLRFFITIPISFITMYVFIFSIS